MVDPEQPGQDFELGLDESGLSASQTEAEVGDVSAGVSGSSSLNTSRDSATVTLVEQLGIDLDVSQDDLYYKLDLLRTELRASGLDGLELSRFFYDRSNEGLLDLEAYFKALNELIPGLSGPLSDHLEALFLILDVKDEDCLSVHQLVAAFSVVRLSLSLYIYIYI